MTTWTDVAAVSDTYTGAADDVTGYVLADYVVNGYIDVEPGWSVVASVSTTWS